MSNPVNGSVRQRSPGRWELRVSLGRDPQTSKRLVKSKSVDAKDQAHARRLLTRFIVQVGDHVPADHITLGRVIETWYAHTASRRETRSNETMRINIDRHILPGVEDLPVVSVDVARLEGFYHQLAGKGLAPATVRQVHFIIRPALRLAVRYGWIESNPADLVERGPLRAKIVRPPSADSVIQLMGAAAANPALATFIRLCAVTGCRCGEVSALRWADVDWLGAELTISSALSHTKAGLELKGIKTARGERIIGIDFDTLASLEGQRARNLADGAEDGPARFVFPDLRTDGIGAMPISPKVWSTRFWQLRKSLGIECRLHDLRHFAATSLLTDGVPVAAVSAMLGHARISTTVDIYGLWASRGSDPKLAEALAARLTRPLTVA